MGGGLAGTFANCLPESLSSMACATQEAAQSLESNGRDRGPMKLDKIDGSRWRLAVAIGSRVGQPQAIEPLMLRGSSQWGESAKAMAMTLRFESCCRVCSAGLEVYGSTYFL